MKAKKPDRPTYVERVVIPAAKSAIDYMNYGTKTAPAKTKMKGAPARVKKAAKKY